MGASTTNLFNIAYGILRDLSWYKTMDMDRSKTMFVYIPAG